MRNSNKTVRSRNVMLKRLKRRIFEILNLTLPTRDPISRLFDIFMLTVITLSVIAAALETQHRLIFYKVFFTRFEYFVLSVFTIEYILRLWTCTLDRKFRQPISGRIRFALTPMALIDLLAILPGFLLLLPMGTNLDIRIVRVLRLFQLLRLLKMSRYSDAIQTMVRVARLRKEELTVSSFMFMILVTFASGIVYSLETEAQPDKFSSIPMTMMWGIHTLTGTGSDDMYPITPMGRFLGAVVEVLGIGLFALPAGIFAGGFIEEMQKKREKPLICPHCGEEIKTRSAG